MCERVLVASSVHEEVTRDSHFRRPKNSWEASCAIASFREVIAPVVEPWHWSAQCRAFYCPVGRHFYTLPGLLQNWGGDLCKAGVLWTARRMWFVCPCCLFHFGWVFVGVRAPRPGKMQRSCHRESFQLNLAGGLGYPSRAYHTEAPCFPLGRQWKPRV